MDHTNGYSIFRNDMTQQHVSTLPISGKALADELLNTSDYITDVLERLGLDIGLAENQSLLDDLDHHAVLCKNCNTWVDVGYSELHPTTDEEWCMDCLEHDAD